MSKMLAQVPTHEQELSYLAAYRDSEGRRVVIPSVAKVQYATTEHLLRWLESGPSPTALRQTYDPYQQVPYRAVFQEWGVRASGAGRTRHEALQRCVICAKARLHRWTPAWKA